MPRILGTLLADGDLVLTMGAGDIGALAGRLPGLLQAEGDVDATS